MNLNENKFKVIDDLLDAGNQCLIRFSDRNELASEYDKRVSTLYQCFEIFFLHGLKENHNPFNLTRKMISNSLSNSPKNFNNFISIKDNHNLDFWRFICYFLNKHEIERFTHLKHSGRTSLGCCRSWLRSSLNEHTLEKTLKSMLENGQTILKQFYDEESAIRESSKQNEILELVQKLNSVLFASSIDNSNLNSFNTINQENFDNQAIQESKNLFDKQHFNKLENQLNSAMQNLVNNESAKQASNEERTSLNSNLSSNQSCNNSAKLDLYLPISRNSSYSSYNQPDDNTSNKSDEDQIDPNINTNVLLTPIVAGNYLITDQLMAANYEEDDNKSDCNTSCSSTPAFHSKELANFEKTKRQFELEYDLMNKQKEQSKIELDNESNSSNKQPKKLFTSPTNSTTATNQDYEERLIRLESQNDQLKQENKLLKDQLKKYIDAIQLLQSTDRDAIFNKCANNLITNTNLIDNDNSLSEQQINEQNTKNKFNDKQFNDKSTTEFNTSAYLNYRDSIEYEKKLVQVAEMNSEIVEYNDRLNRILMQKDAIIKRLKEQLVDLRGPLPDNIIQSDDEEIVSIASDNENQSLQFNTILTQNRPLINIYIPSAFLADHKQTYQNNYLNTDSQQRTNKKIKSHHVYQIYIRIKDDEWNCYKRYSQFYSLHQILKKKYQQISELEFPPKKTLGNRNAKVVQDRRKKLESYLRNVLNILQNDNNIYDRSTLIEVLPFLNEKYVLQNNNRNNDTNSNELNLGEGIVQQQDYIGL